MIKHECVSLSLVVLVPALGMYKVSLNFLLKKEPVLAVLAFHFILCEFLLSMFCNRCFELTLLC
jgi:hypothetical protein